MNVDTTIRQRGTRSARLAALVLGVALIAGCGSGASDEPLSATEHNGADVAFAQDMIQHHAQALAMVNLTVERTVGPEFEALAVGIRDAQGPEIETMADWLDEWGEDVPETVNDHANAEGHSMPEGSDEMPGMMSADEMSELESAPDAEFEKLWLEMMVRHHQGAIKMAGTEEADGRFRPAVELARSIIDSQTEEIKAMQGLIEAS